MLLLIYAIAATTYAMTGNILPGLQDASLTGLVVLFILVGAFLEEVAFRGLLLHAYVRTWGSTYRGLIQGLLVSSLFFASIHLLDFLSGRPLANILLQSLGAIFLGIIFGALVLTGKSIYLATAFHFVLNVVGYLVIAGSEPAASSWLLYSLLMTPVAIFCLYWVKLSSGAGLQAFVPSSPTASQ